VGYTPRNDSERECYAVLLQDLEELSDARKYRMVAAKSQLSPILWAVLIAGGIMIVLFTYFFFVENLISQLLMTGCVVIFLSMNVYLIYVCQNPYRPELGAKEAGFGFSFNPNWFRDEPPTETTKTEASAKADLTTNTEVEQEKSK
jgi:small-conductance mechanosensitive channel